MSTILIVEDNDPFREMLRTVMELRGFTVLAAENPLAGIALAADQQVDAVISDFQMPKADGLSFCRMLKHPNTPLKRNVPVWLMTGTVALSEKEARLAGAEGVFRKPFHVAEITKAIERHFSPRRGATASRGSKSQARPSRQVAQPVTDATSSAVG